MSEINQDEVAQIARIFINLGATEKQAPILAAQLLKRADQIAEERNISKIDATQTLLKQVVEARQGL